jgi:hypothetical protein
MFHNGAMCVTIADVGAFVTRHGEMSRYTAPLFQEDAYTVEVGFIPKSMKSGSL